ncbi:MAG: hypothetical protein BJG00_018785 [Limnothrix sp. CACIAM 69d]|nr:MAG: hypothetical protein BJG00_018785 [Limnothrix sp. CACIAM 69d]
MASSHPSHPAIEHQQSLPIDPQRRDRPSKSNPRQSRSTTPLNQPHNLHKERARQRQTLSQTDFKKLSLLTASAPPPIATDQNWRVENDYNSTVD